MNHDIPSVSRHSIQDRFSPKKSLAALLALTTLSVFVRGQWSRAADAPAAAVIPFESVEDIKEPILFDKHVFPILAEKCMTCHDEEGGLAEGDLDVLTVEAILRGGKKGPSLVAGKGGESLIVQLASHAAKPIMPPKGEKPLTPRELSILKTWIDQGAKPGENLTPATSLKKEVLLNPLPPGVHPVYALDMDGAGSTLIAGRANQVFVYDLPSGSLRAQLTGHQDLVQSVRLSPDGQWIAAGGYQVVKLWQVPQAKEQRLLAGHSSPVRDVVVNAVSGLVATASEDQTVRVWNLATGTTLREMAGHPAPIHGLALAADCSLLATACADKNARVFQTASGRLLGTLGGHGDKVLSVAFSADRHWLASGGADPAIRLWDIDKLRAAAAEGKGIEPERVLTGHAKPVAKIVFAGDKVVSASEDGVIMVWNLADGAKIRDLAHGAAAAGLAVTADGQTLVSGGADQTVKIWSLADGALKGTLTGHAQPVLSLAVSPDGTAVAAGAADNSIRVWDLKTFQLLYSIAGHSGPIYGLSFGGDAKMLISASGDKSVKVWETTAGWGDSQDLAPFTERVLALDFSPDSSLLATGGGVPAASGELIVWDLGKRQPLQTIQNAHSDTVFGVAFSPDGKLLASASGDKFLKVHEVGTGKFLKSFEGHTHHLLGVGWKKDGKQIATAGADNSVKTWNYESGEQIRTIGGFGKQVTGLEWVGVSALLATSCGDRQARFVNTDNGQIARGFSGATEYLYCVAVSADGKRIASGAQDGKIFVWNGDDGKLLLTLDVPQSVQTAEK